MSRIDETIVKTFQKEQQLSIQSKDSTKQNSDSDGIILELSWFVEAIHKMQTNDINVKIELDLDLYDKKTKNINLRRCMRHITAQMKHMKMIKHSLYDIKDINDEIELSKCDICYREDEQEQYICELKSLNITITATKKRLEVEINSCQQ